MAKNDGKRVWWFCCNWPTLHIPVPGFSLKMSAKIHEALAPQKNRCVMISASVFIWSLTGTHIHTHKHIYTSLRRLIFAKLTTKPFTDTIFKNPTRTVIRFGWRARPTDFERSSKMTVHTRILVINAGDSFRECSYVNCDDTLSISAACFGSCCDLSRLWSRTYTSH